MSPPLMNLKWTPRLLFAACTAVGLGAWAYLEEYAQSEWEKIGSGSKGSDAPAEQVSHSSSSSSAWWLSLLHPPPLHRQGFADGTYLPPLASDRVSRRSTSAVDSRPSIGCPNLLVHHDDKFLLFRDDTLVARFSSLEDYQTYAKEQNTQEKEKENAAAAAAAAAAGDKKKKPTKKKRSCPILFVEPDIDTQGRRQYRRRDAHQAKRDRGTVRGLSAAFWDWQKVGSVPTDRPLHSSLGAAADPAPAVKQLKLSPYNEHDMDRWIRSDLAKSAEEARENEVVSDSAMDPNWGGVRWSQQAIDSGKYDSHTAGGVGAAV